MADQTDRYSYADGRERFGFERALEFLKKGAAVTRDGWNGKGMYLKLQVPDEHSKMTEPYIYLTFRRPRREGMAPEQITRIPWLASQADLLWHDWTLVAPE